MAKEKSWKISFICLCWCHPVCNLLFTSKLFFSFWLDSGDKILLPAAAKDCWCRCYTHTHDDKLIILCQQFLEPSGVQFKCSSSLLLQPIELLNEKKKFFFQIKKKWKSENVHVMMRCIICFTWAQKGEQTLHDDEWFLENWANTRVLSHWRE